ncbi:hypothetical protein [Arthrobacter sp. CG_A4]|uniref:hypothetical protein n=1 Tax=Arthrobacter sp. CG_A4 TaxID=3071706 RepID=UPI002E065AB8|nr:hypothetical protein [Arthrobacter sp. CG_A4]
MSGYRRRRYTRLLRWYPRSWRKEHGSIVLDSLEQHAGDRGVARPTSREAWSLRAHGLGERATHRWAAGFAAAALVAYIGATGLLLSNASFLPGAGLVQLLFAVFIGPLALALSAVVLLHRAGRLSAPAALSTAASALPAFGFAALAAASWAAGFDEADAGLGRSWFGTSTLLFLVLAWCTGTICLAAPLSSVLSKGRSLPSRFMQSTVLAAPLALILGALTLRAQIIGTLGSVVLLVVALRKSTSTHPAAPRGAARAAVRSSPPRPVAAWSRQGDAAAGAAALVTVIVGLGCAVFALTGSNWAPMVTDSTHAMNLGLAAGALAAIPATIAAGIMLTPRFGAVMRWSALICCASLLLEAAAQLLGAGHTTQWPLTLAAATLMGFAIALPFGRLLPGGRSLRLGVTVMLGLAGSTIGLNVVTMAAFIAPLAAAVLVVWSLTRLAASSSRPAEARHVGSPS